MDRNGYILSRDMKYYTLIILWYVYKPTRCTKFLWLDFIFSLDALHVSDYNFYKLYIAIGMCRYMPIEYVWLLCGYIHITARRMVPAYTKCDVQLIKLLLMVD